MKSIIFLETYYFRTFTKIPIFLKYLKAERKYNNIKILQIFLDKFCFILYTYKYEKDVRFYL